MSQIARVAIISSFLNEHEKINPTYLSLVNQTEKNWVWIICDDQSKKVPVFPQDNRIKLIANEKNLGLPASLNRCLSHIAPEVQYIARVDFGDISHPHRFEKQIQFFNENQGESVVGTGAKIISEGIFRNELLLPQKIDQILNYDMNLMLHPSVMFKPEFFRMHGNYDETFRRCQDKELWFRALTAGTNLNNIQEALIEYEEGFGIKDLSTLTLNFKSAFLIHRRYRLSGFTVYLLKSLLRQVYYRLKRYNENCN